ncbi:Uu.00g032600.m01.CDS01 [Anthostomella pinea]|uniref:Uu.00g032600.m01.CDS01 n=1 Tax=Anthostomella pinea TaxID=933095 RepID=A0AAI8V974_9PEZI|nr:Uu.00g032600.m01.CDS01 [Anthostomella pinea]
MSGQAVPSYRYRPLEHKYSIRVVTIVPGNFPDKVNLTLAHIRLDQDQPFEALSYTWGDVSDGTRRIYIDHFALVATKNLFEALRRLRHPAERRTIWIDALCINQQDNVEKAVQLPLMRYIYQKASLAVVWVGEAEGDGDDDETRWACQCFEHLATYASMWYDKPQAATQRGVRARLSAFDLPRLFRFLDKPWFTRAWTFQEVCLSENIRVVCGSHCLPWHTLVFAFAAARLGVDGAGLPGVSKFASARADYWALFHLVDPRDRVYSLLGLANIAPGLITPDTSDVTSIYTLTTRALIRQDNSLDFFHQLDKPRPVDDLPSWVPDWRQTQCDKSWEKKEFQASIHRGENTFYNFTLSFIPDFSDLPQTDKEKLVLTGGVFDSVKIVTPTSQFTNRLRELNNREEVTWNDIILEIRLLHAGLLMPERETREHLLLEQIGHYKRDVGLALLQPARRTFVQDVGWVSQTYKDMWIECEESPSPTARPSDGHLAVSKVLKVAKMVFTGSRNNEGTDETRSRMAREYCAMVCSLLEARCVAQTSRGYLALVPSNSRPGDSLCALLGGRVPYVLRPTSRWDGYAICGEGYVHGVMDGELFRIAYGGNLIGSRIPGVFFDQVTLV